MSPDEPVELGGFTFTLTASAEFPGEGVDENQVPIGNALVAAIFQIEPSAGTGPDARSGCDAQLIDTGTGRTWDTVVSERDFGYGIADESSTNCLLQDEPLQYEVVFLTPDSVYDDVVIELTVQTEQETVLWFELVPRG